MFDKDIELFYKGKQYKFKLTFDRIKTIENNLSNYDCNLWEIAQLLSTGGLHSANSAACFQSILLAAGVDETIDDIWENLYHGSGDEIPMALNSIKMVVSAAFFEVETKKKPQKKKSKK